LSPRRLGNRLQKKKGKRRIKNRKGKKSRGWTNRIYGARSLTDEDGGGAKYASRGWKGTGEEGGNGTFYDGEGKRR